MPHYKLTYFDARGLGEVARQLFILADVPFEDDRLSLEQFQERKSTFPSGHVPILRVDGFEISQSAAIWRYLARKFGLAGKNAEEEALADSIVDHFKDFIVVFKNFTSGLFFGKSEDEMKKIRNEIAEPAVTSYFKVMNQFLKNSKSGFLVGDGLTYADLVVAESLTTLKKHGFFNPQEEKSLDAFYQRISETPKLKAYLEKRKDTVV